MSTSQPEDNSMLSNGQRRVMGFALTLLALTVSSALLIFLFILLGKLLGQFSNVLWPVAAAGVLALILRPAVNAVEKRLRVRRSIAVVILYAIFLVVVGTALVLIVPPLASQILDLLAYLPDLWKNATEYAQRHYPEWVQLLERFKTNPTVASLFDSARDEMAKIPSLILPSIQALSSGLFATFSFFTHFAVLPIYLFFFMLSRADPTEKLEDHLGFLKPGIRDDVVFLVDQFIAIIVSFFRGQLLIGIIMGILMAIGFFFVGLEFGVLIGLCLGILNIVPYLGTIVGLTVTIPLAFFQPNGGLTLVALVLLVYIFVQCVEGWILTPKIMGDRTGLHPGVIIFAIFFWGTALNGIMGMILAIPLTAFFVTFWRLLKRKYFPNGDEHGKAKKPAVAKT